MTVFSGSAGGRSPTTHHNFKFPKSPKFFNYPNYPTYFNYSNSQLITHNLLNFNPILILNLNSNS